MTARTIAVRGVAIALVGIGAAAGATLGFAGGTVSQARITACIDSSGYLFIQAPSSRTCPESVTWNQEGPAGPQGPAGPPGPASPVATGLASDAVSVFSGGVPVVRDAKKPSQGVARRACPTGMRVVGGGGGVSSPSTHIAIPTGWGATRVNGTVDPRGWEVTVTGRGGKALPQGFTAYLTVICVRAA